MRFRETNSESFSDRPADRFVTGVTRSSSPAPRSAPVPAHARSSGLGRRPAPPRCPQTRDRPASDAARHRPGARKRARVCHPRANSCPITWLFREHLANARAFAIAADQAPPPISLRRPSTRLPSSRRPQFSPPPVLAAASPRKCARVCHPRAISRPITSLFRAHPTNARAFASPRSPIDRRTGRAVGSLTRRVLFRHRIRLLVRDGDVLKSLVALRFCLSGVGVLVTLGEFDIVGERCQQRPGM